MATITEDYVSFKVAELLKEKGFNEPCVTQYDKRMNFEYGLGVRNSDLVDNAYKAPTLQMAMKWLREVHGVHISIMYNERYAHPYEFCVVKQHYASKSDMHRYTTYEGCAEKAITFSLENLIC